MFSKLIQAFKINAAFTKHNIEKEKLSLGEARLTDGTVVVYPGDVPVVGDPVGVMVEGETEPVPAPEGNHELEDGTIIVTDMNSIIVEIIPADAPTEEEPATPTEPTPAEAQAKKIIESITKQTEFRAAVDELIAAAIEPIKAENERLKSELEEEKKFSANMFAIVEKIGGEPASKPVEKPSKVSKAEENFSKQERILARIKEMKNQKN